MGCDVGTTGINFGQFAICSWTFVHDEMCDLILTSVTCSYLKGKTSRLTINICGLMVKKQTNKQIKKEVGVLWLTFLLHPRHGALYEESCFSTLEDLSTFLGSKGIRHRGQRGDVTWRHGWRQSLQNLHRYTNSGVEVTQSGTSAVPVVFRWNVQVPCVLIGLF